MIPVRNQLKTLADQRPFPFALPLLRKAAAARIRSVQGLEQPVLEYRRAANRNVALYLNQMPGRLILVRHGETEANLRRVFADSDDIPLTEAGRRQAEQLALRLAREFTPRVLVASHFRRARETSEIIGRALGLAPESIPGIHERDFGSLKGLPYERLATADQSVESLESVRRRAITAIEALRLRYPAHEIVLVSHGGVIQAICAHITGVWTEESVPPNCGLVIIEYDADRWQAPIKSGDWDRITQASSPLIPDRPRS